MTKPRVSVVVTFRDEIRFLREAVESVFNQTYDDWDLTLVDDGPIHIGDNVMFGPNVVVTTAGTDFPFEAGLPAFTGLARKIQANTMDCRIRFTRMRRRRRASRYGCRRPSG